MAKFRKKNVGVALDAQVDAPSSGIARVERDRIAERAYELYVNRGRESGRELDDWLAAERELTAPGTGKNTK